MSSKDFFAIGHVTKDLPTIQIPFEHPGGGVSYSAVAAERLGWNATIITKCPENHPYLMQLKDLGVSISNLKVENSEFADKITSFRNVYDERGNRQQRVTQIQEEVTVEDRQKFPKIPYESIILIAPVIHEVDVGLFSELSNLGHLVVTPQGYFRQLEDGVVKRRPWIDVEMLHFAKITILSDEDLTFNGDFNQEVFRKVKEACPLVVLTEGPRGLTIFEGGIGGTHVNVFKLTEEELRKGDFTGAGDVTATAFVDHYMRWGHPKEAGAFAAYYAALKIANIKGEGMGLLSIPDRGEVQDFSRKNPERFLQFLRENDLRSLPLSTEGQNRSPERR